MTTGWGSHLRLLGIVVLCASTLGLGEWETTGGRSFQVLINTQSEMRTGDWCHAYANVYNGSAPYTYLWESDDLWNGTTQVVSRLMQYSGTFAQVLHAWDAGDNYDVDVRLGLRVEENGSECGW